MNHTITMLLIGIISASFGVLITYFVTSLSQAKLVKTLTKEMVYIHEKIHHKKPTDVLIDKHKKDCKANNDFSLLQSAIIFLVTKQGGNLRELGLS